MHGSLTFGCFRYQLSTEYLQDQMQHACHSRRPPFLATDCKLNLLIITMPLHTGGALLLLALIWPLFWQQAVEIAYINKLWCMLCTH